ncbi:MAG: type II secretion system secretin GspD [Gammaproteobacteria bacterium]
MTVKTSKAPYVVTLALTLSGCELIGPQPHAKIPLPEPVPVDETLYSAAANQEVEERTTKSEVFANEEPSIASIKSSTPGKKGTGKAEYSLNFDDADLGEVAKVILSDILKRNYTISPQVSGKVTMQTTQPLSREDLIPTLEMLLGLNNAALSLENDMYTIRPANEAVYSASFQSLGSSHLPSGYQTRVIPVRNVAADDIAEILKPLLPEKSQVSVDPSRNILLASGSAAELARIMDVVRTFDVDILKGRSFALFTPAHVDASKIIDELEQVFNPVSAGDKSGGSTFFRFIEIERLNAVLAITHNAKYLQDIERWVQRLDRTNTEISGGVNVYRAQHVSALELADTLGQIFGGAMQRGGSRSASIASGRNSFSASNKSSSSSAGSSSRGGGSSMGGSSSMGVGSGQAGGKGDSIMDKSLSDKNQNRSMASGMSGGIGGSGMAGGMGSNDPEMQNVRIIPDDGNNALVIVANSEQYAKILKVIKQLDVLPLQVIIDATIVEVSLVDELKYGIQWFLTHQNGGNNLVKGGASNGIPVVDDGSGGVTIPLDKLAGAMSGGLSYAFASRSGDINAILNANATNNNVNVISSPSLMVLNNQEATIKVGDSVPIRSAVSSNLSGNSNNGIVQTSSIQMVDTGVILSVRPRVNSGGLVLMDVMQSVNQATETKTSTNIDSPTIQKREIETSIVVQSGETLVLGGLIKEDNTYNRSGVPLLHEIPVLGPLFGGTTRNKNKSELVVLITPRVVNSRQDAQSITDEFRRKLSSIYELPPAVEDERI